MEEKTELEVWTIKECAEFLRVSRNTIYKMVSDRRLPNKIFARKVGNCWRISSREVIKFLEENDSGESPK